MKDRENARGAGGRTIVADPENALPNGVARSPNGHPVGTATVRAGAPVGSRGRSTAATGSSEVNGPGPSRDDDVVRHASRTRDRAAGYPVLVIDDHELFSTSLTMALRAEGLDARTLGVAGVRAYLRGTRSGATGLAVLDLDLGRDADGRYVSGAELVEALRERGWKVLIVSGSGDRPGIAAAIAAGAIGTVPKSRSFEVLLTTVTTAARGEPVMTESERQEWIERHRRYVARERETSRRLARLTTRERDVLELLSEGTPATAIAEHFGASMSTVRTQIRSILATLEVGSQLEAVALFRQMPEPSGREPGASSPDRT
jgi:DNA-binding NarL/FixJ family response regulator